MAEFVSAQGQLGDVAATTTIHTVTTGKELHQLDIVFFNTDTVAVEVILYIGAKATSKKILKISLSAPPSEKATFPMVIKQRLAAGTDIDAEAESGKGSKINYFFTGIEV